MRRRFSTKSYPKFGKREDVEKSPYFHWFCFMKLYYKDNNKKHADFGDIRKLSFKQFWKKFDTYFLEKQTKEYTFKIAKNQADIVPFNSKDVLNVVVPIKNWNKSNLRKYFEKQIITKVSEGKKGIHVEDSTAEYKLNRRYRISAFKRAYAVYNAREDNEDYTWYDVAIEANCFRFHRQKYIDVGDITPRTTREKNMGLLDEHFQLRNSLTTLALRHYKSALNFINASVTKNFP